MTDWLVRPAAAPIRQAKRLRLKRTTRTACLAIPSLFALTGLLLLELLPTTGPALARAGAPYVAGWLVQVCLLATLIDAARGALPRVVAVIPLLLYGGYWSAFWEQGRRAEVRSEAVRRSNPGAVLAFDPLRHALVTENAEAFVASHLIPVVYARDPSRRDGYRSYRVAAGSDAGSSPPVGKIARSASDDVSAGAAAEARAGSVPITAAISDHPGDLWKDWGIGERVTEVSANGALIGVFHAAYVDRLPPFPFVAIGCAYQPGASRECSARFLTERVTIESRPRSVDPSSYDDGLSVMLKVMTRSESDPARTHGTKVAPTNGDLSEREAEDNAFAAFENIVKGGDDELPPAVIRTLASNPSRLGRLASPMATRFLELYRTTLPEAPGRDRVLSLLAGAISALSPTAFAGVQDRLAPIVGELSRFPLLYVRMADAGAAAYPRYRDRIMGGAASEAELTLSILAVCRLGFADDELVASMKSKLTAATAPSGSPALVSAIFVTLMKLGQEGPAAETSLHDPAWLRTWRSEVKSGRGRTDVGPNNCMPAEWPFDEDIPAVMAPGLVWVRGGWQPGLTANAAAKPRPDAFSVTGLPLPTR